MYPPKIYKKNEKYTLQDNCLDYTTGFKYQLKSKNSSFLCNNFEYLLSFFN